MRSAKSSWNHGSLLMMVGPRLILVPKLCLGTFSNSVSSLIRNGVSKTCVPKRSLGTRKIDNITIWEDAPTGATLTVAQDESSLKNGSGPFGAERKGLEWPERLSRRFAALVCGPWGMGR